MDRCALTIYRYSFPCIAVFVSTQEDIDFREKSYKEDDLYTPLEYIAESLYFINIPKRTVKRWSPEGELFFSDWSFDIWSKGGNYVALLQDHIGPIFVYRAKDFIESVDIDPHYIIYGREPGSEDPAAVTKFMEWKTDNVLIYSLACCGHESVYEYDILSGKYKTLRSGEIHYSGIALGTYPIR
ncbi:MAG: hypothetical protein COX16_03010 [Deltaproteobacteria bacterium CG23_combo_of_CG06-09_8_20_14_all_51_20]|nr:MAG: hypothetical protein AUK25_07910 [Desulfobacteraceae bacterium CG2_30_51_40]PIP47828.1 MAG: hypothetical protein COX16_03010 [Deltaproteobacteria bacterium CG23_combo_of_CG06-09_8_20_14_all_51_20]PIY24568.1 MAG: hypothetical protein COZ11_07290 [Deltaproteobacteria bacterium CG_4_10_14_3_um_filter_51_14]